MTLSPIPAKAGLAILGAAVGWQAIKDVSTSEHDKTVKSAYNSLSSASESDTTIYADHISKGPNPRGEVEGLEMVPDIVVKSGSQSNLLIEVETAESIASNPTHAAEQLTNFRKHGYKRVLVVPMTDGGSDIVSSWRKEIEAETNGKMHLSVAEDVHKLL